MISLRNHNNLLHGKNIIFSIGLADFLDLGIKSSVSYKIIHHTYLLIIIDFDTEIAIKYTHINIT